MKVIVGLGNPGPRYSRTRHNVGFAVIAELGRRHGLQGRSRGPVIVGEGTIAGEPVALGQPTTMMNLSGRAVAHLLHTHNLRDLSALLIVYDDLDLPLGALRLRERGSAGGHNGMKSIIEVLRTHEFPRLRVGIGRPPPGQDPADYVLTRFRPEEKPILEQVIRVAADAVEYWIQHGSAETMNAFNRWRPDVGALDGGTGEGSDETR